MGTSQPNINHFLFLCLSTNSLIIFIFLIKPVIHARKNTFMGKNRETETEMQDNKAPNYGTPTVVNDSG